MGEIVHLLLLGIEGVFVALQSGDLLFQLGVLGVDLRQTHIAGHDAEEHRKDAGEDE